MARNGDDWGEPEHVAELGSPDASYIIFAASGRPDSFGEDDLYYSEKRDTGWSEPVNLGPRAYGKVLNYDELIERIRSPGNGLRDIYGVELDAVLKTARGE